MLLQLKAGYLKFNPVTAVPDSGLAFALRLVRPLFEQAAGDASERVGDVALVLVCWDPAAAPGTHLHLDWLRAENVAVALNTGSDEVRCPAALLPCLPAPWLPLPAHSPTAAPVQWAPPTAPLAVWMFVAPWAMQEADEAARTALVSPAPAGAALPPLAPHCRR